MQVLSSLPPGRLCRPPSAGQEGRRWDQGSRRVGLWTLLRVLWTLGSASSSPPTFPSPSSVFASNPLSGPLSGVVAPVCPLLAPSAPFPACLPPLERGQNLVMCGDQAPPGSLVRGWTGTATREHPPWGTNHRDARPGKGTLNQNHYNLKTQQPSLFCVL